MSSSEAEGDRREPSHTCDIEGPEYAVLQGGVGSEALFQGSASRGDGASSERRIGLSSRDARARNVQAEASNPLSRWIDQGVVSLGFQGRLAYRPPSKFPIRPSEQPPARHAKSMKAIAQGKTVPSRH
jgi:hypothetical protein